MNTEKFENLLNEIKEYSKILYKSGLGWYPYTINRLICMLEDNKDVYNLHRKYFFKSLNKLSEKGYGNLENIIKILEIYETINDIVKSNL